MNIIEKMRNAIGENHRGHPVALKMLDDKTVLIVVQTAPAGRLRLSQESEMTHRLDQMEILGETQLGDLEFDKRYVIREGDPGSAHLLTPSVRKALVDLEPFLEFEMTTREYRMLKEVLPKDLPAVMDGLIDVVEQTRPSHT